MGPKAQDLALELTDTITFAGHEDDTPKTSPSSPADSSRSGTWSSCSTSLSSGDGVAPFMASLRDTVIAATHVADSLAVLPSDPRPLPSRCSGGAWRSAAPTSSSAPRSPNPWPRRLPTSRARSPRDRGSQPSGIPTRCSPSGERARVDDEAIAHVGGEHPLARVVHVEGRDHLASGVGVDVDARAEPIDLGELAASQFSGNPESMQRMLPSLSLNHAALPMLPISATPSSHSTPGMS